MPPADRDKRSEFFPELPAPHGKEGKIAYRPLRKPGCMLESVHRSNNRRSHPPLPWPKPDKSDSGPDHGLLQTQTHKSSEIRDIRQVGLKGKEAVALEEPPCFQEAIERVEHVIEDPRAHEDIEGVLTQLVDHVLERRVRDEFDVRVQ